MENSVDRGALAELRGINNLSDFVDWIVKNYPDGPGTCPTEVLSAAAVVVSGIPDGHEETMVLRDENVNRIKEILKARQKEAGSER